MPRFAKEPMVCLECDTKIDGVLYSILFGTQKGWCSEECFNAWADREESRKTVKPDRHTKADGSVTIDPTILPR